jgi:anti-anti-sigma regulatory factor
MQVSRHGLTIVVVERGDLVILFLDGELDRVSTPLLVKMLSGLDRQHVDRVWVNVAGLSRIDAGGIDALLEARSRTNRFSREFLVRSPSCEVTLAFEERADCADLCDSW